MKNVCVFCSSSHGARPSYGAAAEHFGEVLAARGLSLVYGGAHVGLMGTIADAVLRRGGAVFGVIPAVLAAKEIAHPGLTELRVVASMHERKALMAERADAFVALPGGFGTLDELFEILTWAQLGLHQKPCGLLNVDGFFDGLIAYLDHAVKEQLLKAEHRAVLIVETTPEALLERLSEYRPVVVEKWIRSPSET
jgi:uncharacterized protein (TIGR00730 family)